MSADNTLRQLRYNRTRASNLVRRMIASMLLDEAKWTSPDGLPSWWPFWSDCLRDRVRETVRAARELEKAEDAEKLHSA